MTDRVLNDDEKLVLRLGFTDIGTPEWPIYRSPDSHRGGPVSYVVYDPFMGCDGWSVNDQMITPPELDEHVRQLCAGLGIELTEQPSDKRHIAELKKQIRFLEDSVIRLCNENDQLRKQGSEPKTLAENEPTSRIPNHCNLQGGRNV